MKKRNILFILILCFIGLNYISAETNITGQVITGEVVTGKALQSSLALNITVTVPVPVITILSPENKTYLTNQSLLISYIVVNGDSMWYNFDLGANTTLVGSTHVNVSQGAHTLYIYGNNTYGLTVETVSFIANSTLLTILYSEYNGSTKGNSTAFTSYTYEDLQNLGSVVLENINYGKILFGERINLTNDLSPADNLVDLDSNTEITHNSIQLNSTALPNFNTSATIWLYNLSFTTPRILKDGIVCPSSQCIKETYTGGTLRFYVTQFSNYSAEESPATPPTPPSTGGGGGGTRVEEIIEEYTGEPEDNITVISKEITVSVEQGKTTTENFYLSSNYEGVLKVNLAISGLGGFLKSEETQFELDYKQIKTIKLNFSIPKDTPADNYIGKIILTTPSGEVYESFISINVQSEKSLFDVSLKLNQDKLPAHPGEYIYFKTTIQNIGEDEDLNINIKYTIKDTNGKVIFEGEGVEEIGNYLEKDGKIKLPKNLPLGKYTLSVKVNYGDKTAITSANFDVGEKKLPRILRVAISIAAVFFILFILWIIGRKEEKKKKRERERKEEELEY